METLYIRNKAKGKNIYIVYSYLARLEYEDFEEGTFNGLKHTSKKSIKYACLSCIDRSPFGYEEIEEFTNLEKAKQFAREEMSHKHTLWYAGKHEKPFFPYVLCYLVYKASENNNGHETFYTREEIPKAFYIKKVY